MKSQHLTGYISEQKAALYFAELGYIIYWPNHSQSSCDFIACKDEELIRIQVKSAYWMTNPTGKNYLQATVKKGSSGLDSYTKQHCDLIVAVAKDGRIWVIPIEDIGKIQMIVLDKKVKIRKSYAKDWSVYEVKGQHETMEKDAQRLGEVAVKSIEQAGETLNLTERLTGSFMIGNNWSECH